MSEMFNCTGQKAGDTVHRDCWASFMGTSRIVVFTGSQGFFLRVLGVVRCWTVITALMLLSSCTTSVVVEGSVPTPLVSKIPARMGIYYSEEFSQFTYQESIKDAGSWSIDLGDQNLSFFRNLTDSLFNSVTEVHEPPLSSEEMQNLDGLFVPYIEKYGFLTPAISGLKFYSASIEYRIVMFDKSGEKIGDWNIVGYGKSEGGMFTADEAINEATVLAIRDGGARIAIELIDQPAIRAWLHSLESPEAEAN